MERKKLVKNKIDEDMKKIIDVVLKYTKPVSIILFGSFSKYEGFTEIINGKVLPLNDYDLYLITNKKLGDKFIEDLGEKGAKAIGRGGKEFLGYSGEDYDKDKFFHVDFREIKYKNLKKLLPTQRTFELKNSKVIWGEDVLSLIPDVKVSVSDAIRLLFNKMHHFLFVKNNKDNIKLIYATKGFTDSASALLIYYGVFVSGYENRVNEISKLNLPKGYIDNVKIATKIRLDFPSDINLDEFYKSSLEWAGWSFKHIITGFLNIKENDIKVIADKMYKKLPYIYFKPYLPFNLFLLQYYLNIKFVFNCLKNKRFIIKPLFRWRDSGIILGIAMMLLFFGEDEESKKYLNKITRVKNLYNDLMELYGYYYLQKLI